MTLQIRLGFRIMAMGVAGLAGPALAQDAAHGKTVYARCSACHSVTPGGRSGMGPNLFGILGRTAGTLAGFSYSPAMKGAGFKWTKEKLDAFLKSPSATVPGNRMPFGGVPDKRDRDDLVAYLATLKGK